MPFFSQYFSSVFTPGSSVPIVAQYFSPVFTPSGKSPVDIESALCKDQDASGYCTFTISYAPLRPGENHDIESLLKPKYYSRLTVALYLAAIWFIHLFASLTVNAHDPLHGLKLYCSFTSVFVLAGIGFTILVRRQIPAYIPDPCPLDEIRVEYATTTSYKLVICSFCFWAGVFYHVSPGKDLVGDPDKLFYTVIHVSLIGAWHIFTLSFPKYNYIL